MENKGLKVFNTITINQNNPDPFARVSGDVNGDVIKWIRQNSHRVLAKKTAEGEVVYCRLSDSGGAKYHDGTPADLTGPEGDVFVKLPKFYYTGTEGDKVNITFSAERTSDGQPDRASGQAPPVGRDRMPARISLLAKSFDDPGEYGGPLASG